jgi:hypothetical protein
MHWQRVVTNKHTFIRCTTSWTQHRPSVPQGGSRPLPLQTGVRLFAGFAGYTSVGHLVRRKPIPHMSEFRFIFWNRLGECVYKSHEQFEAIIEFLGNFRRRRLCALGTHRVPSPTALGKVG